MLWLLVTGVLLWSLVHLFPSVMPAKRAQLRLNLGSKYDGLFALAILLSIGLMVVGWRNSVPEPVYTPPAWGRHVTMLLMLVSMILFAASGMKTHLQRMIRHPMLSAVLVWGIAHLLANGDLRSLVLFSGMIVWSVLCMVFINRRDGSWHKPPGHIAWLDEAKLFGGSLLVYLLLVFLHPYFAGMPLMPT